MSFPSALLPIEKSERNGYLAQREPSRMFITSDEKRRVAGTTNSEKGTMILCPTKRLSGSARSFAASSIFRFEPLFDALEKSVSPSLTV